MTFLEFFFQLIELLRSEAGPAPAKLRSVVVLVVLVVAAGLRTSVLQKNENRIFIHIIRFENL
jgi:hypothetical protein